MARGRRRKYTWFPTQHYDQFRGDDTYEIAGITRSDGLAFDISPVTDIWPINPVDSPREDDIDIEDATMADVIGSEYFLKRIVGKFFCGLQPRIDIESPTPTAALVTAGFFVARASSVEPAVPIGAEDLDTAPFDHSGFKEYSPQAVATIREPWIWRRSWVLGNKAVVVPIQIGGTASYFGAPVEWGAFPSTTAGYGSVADGPHIDAKTARRITQDDRLFFVVGAHGLPHDTEDAAQLEVFYHLDYRLLGALRKPRQTGRF